MSDDEIWQLRMKVRRLHADNKRLRAVLLKLIEKIENRDDMPTEEYRAALESKS